MLRRPPIPRVPMTLAVTRSWAVQVTLVALLGACTSYESAYEKAVYDDEPVYCYQSLAGTDCYRTAYRRDDRRLINYYGPAPSRYRPPRLPEPIPAQAPPEGNEAPEGVRSASAASSGESAASGGPATPDSSRERSAWRDWLPLFSVAFGALQVVAAFVM